MIYVTSITDEEGNVWEAERISAISWTDAEHQASMMGVEIVGLLIKEEIVDDKGNTIQTIDYDNIQNN